MTVIRDHAGLQDAWVATHPSTPSSRSAPSPYDAIQVHGVTADSPINSYSAGKPLDIHARAAQGKRLDYVLYRDPHHHPFSSPLSYPKLVCANTRVMLTETVPGRSFSYSDHFGLEATLLIQHPEAHENTLPSDPSALADVPSVSSVSAPAPTTPSTHLSDASATAILQALTTCYRHARARSQQELLICVLCAVLVVAFVIGAAWLPHTAYAPIFAFGAAFSTWLGTTMLYIGFIYGRWEVNALMNVIEELELYRRGIDSTAGQGGVEDTSRGS